MTVHTLMLDIFKLFKSSCLTGLEKKNSNLVQGKKFKLGKSYAVPRDATFPTFSGFSYLIVILR